MRFFSTSSAFALLTVANMAQSAALSHLPFDSSDSYHAIAVPELSDDVLLASEEVLIQKRQAPAAAPAAEPAAAPAAATTAAAADPAAAATTAPAANPAAAATTAPAGAATTAAAANPAAAATTAPPAAGATTAAAADPAADPAAAATTAGVAPAANPAVPGAAPAVPAPAGGGVAPGGGAGAATAPNGAGGSLITTGTLSGMTQLSPVTVTYGPSEIAPGNTQYVPITYSQSFASVPSQGPTPQAGEIGLGDSNSEAEESTAASSSAAAASMYSSAHRTVHGPNFWEMGMIGSMVGIFMLAGAGMVI